MERNNLLYYLSDNPKCVSCKDQSMGFESFTLESGGSTSDYSNQSEQDESFLDQFVSNIKDSINMETVTNVAEKLFDIEKFKNPCVEPSVVEACKQKDLELKRQYEEQGLPDYQKDKDQAKGTRDVIKGTATLVGSAILPPPFGTALGAAIGWIGSLFASDPPPPRRPGISVVDCCPQRKQNIRQAVYQCCDQFMTPDLLSYYGANPYPKTKTGFLYSPDSQFGYINQYLSNDTALQIFHDQLDVILEFFLNGIKVEAGFYASKPSGATITHIIKTLLSQGYSYTEKIVYDFLKREFEQSVNNFNSGLSSAFQQQENNPLSYQNTKNRYTSEADSGGYWRSSGAWIYDPDIANSRSFQSLLTPIEITLSSLISNCISGIAIRDLKENNPSQYAKVMKHFPSIGNVNSSDMFIPGFDSQIQRKKSPLGLILLAGGIATLGVALSKRKK